MERRNCYEYTAKEYWTYWRVRWGYSAYNSCYEDRGDVENPDYVCIADHSRSIAYQDYVADYQHLYDLIPADKDQNMEVHDEEKTN